MCSKIFEWVKASDMLGVQVGLTHKGQAKYNSVCGGIVTIIITVGLSLYIALGLKADILEPEYLSLPPNHQSNKNLTLV